MKIAFTRPQGLNGERLIAELETAGVRVNYGRNEPIWPEIDGDGVLWLHIDPADESLAATVVAAHVGDE